MANLNTLGDVICKIVRDYGEAKLLDTQFTLAVFMDLAPQMKREKELLLPFLRCGGPHKILKAKKASRQEQELCMNKLVCELEETYGMSENAARHVCAEFYRGVTGDAWTFPAPMTGAVKAKAPESVQPAQTKDATAYGNTAQAQTVASTYGSTAQNRRPWWLAAVAAALLLCVLIIPKLGKKQSGSATETPGVSNQTVQNQSSTGKTPQNNAPAHVHQWKNATYNDPKTCTTCGKVEGAVKTPTTRLHINDIILDSSASSIMSGSDKYQHVPRNLYDQDKLTNWTEGVSGDGLGEFVTFFFDGTYAIKEITILIGSHYQRDTTYFEKNNRPSAITLSFSDGSSEYILLEDTRSYQTITLSEYHYTDYVKLTIEAVYRGTEWNETIIAEVDFAAYAP